MIRHIVIWSMHQPTDAPRFKALLETCAGIVPGIIEFDVGIRTDGLEANADVVLVSTFESQAVLDAYQVHPHHKGVLGQLGPLRSARHVVDYFVDNVGACIQGSCS
ncbi:Dabb family protein [Aquabacterium sp.]|uniref:Dabb family protein n=1 Tax=Aquabacterium sp. TaxID=1872578 RepID=UPI0035B379DC